MATQTGNGQKALGTGETSKNVYPPYKPRELKEAQCRNCLNLSQAAALHKDPAPPRDRWTLEITRCACGLLILSLDEIHYCAFFCNAQKEGTE